MAIPRNIPWPSPRTAGTILAVILGPIALEAGYLLYLKRSVSRRTVSTAGRRLPGPPASQLSKSDGDDDKSGPPADTIPASLKRPATLPAEVADDASSYVLSYERVVSHPIPASSLRDGLTFPSAAQAGVPTPLMTTYLRASMKAFSWTPQAFLIRAAVGADAKATFDAAHIDALAFEHGDRVDGVYTVSYRGCRSGEAEERIELMLNAPEEYRGPVVTGMIAAGVELLPRGGGAGDAEAEQAIFVNETWMWRRLDEKPTMLEGAVGRWLHSLLAGWLVMKGLKAISK